MVGWYTTYSAAAAAWQSRSSEELLSEEGKGRELREVKGRERAEEPCKEVGREGGSLLYLIHLLAQFLSLHANSSRAGRYKKRVKAFGRKTNNHHRSSSISAAAAGGRQTGRQTAPQSIVEEKREAAQGINSTA